MALGGQKDLSMACANLRVQDGDDVEACFNAEALPDGIGREQSQGAKEDELEALVISQCYLLEESSSNSQDTPSVAQENLASKKHLRSIAPPFFLGGKRPLIHRFPTIIITSAINAIILMAQAQLNFSNAGFNTNGNMIPPTLLPTNAIPLAVALLLSNQCATTANAVVVKNAELTPPRIPYTSMKCQYFLHCANSAKLVT